MLIYIFSFYLIFSLYKLIFFAYLYSQLSVDSVLKLARVFYALCNYSKSSKPRKVYLHPKKKGSEAQWAANILIRLIILPI